ncbi:putative U3 small nucleolar RNA-associated protein 7 [Drechslerella stenobrocha 248]|uniref:U three protein 7 n=1 Tax=Drechslerella stenobrocha 248 TaxID=1043628 RepID=W7HU15_9PEZI|nr:putative U3 small nucleolar RNA-associated protein 7 [Drechslerella stenobrocha 248]
MDSDDEEVGAVAVAPTRQTKVAVRTALQRQSKDAPAGEEEKALKAFQHDAIKEFGRGGRVPVKSIKAKRLRENMKRMEGKYREGAVQAKATELLLEESPGYLEAEGLEKTYKFTQDAILKEVDIGTAKKGFELKLPTFGPYCIDYNRTGTDLLLGGRKGHVAAFDWRSSSLHTELQLNETIRDVKWLHNSQFFAVSQKKYVYIYDLKGIEIHCLKKHIEVACMEFLPYHFLLATIGNAGWLKYQDTSTGNLVCEINTKMGTPMSMVQNPRNAILHAGHAKGVVTLWSPNVTTPLVRMLCHKGPVRALAVDREGYYMATAGQESLVSVWDIRMYKKVHSYSTPTPAKSIHISDRGLLAVGWGPHAMVWKDALRTKANSPYLQHLTPGNIVEDLRFCPFEDILGVGHAGGFESLVVPGSGEANFDALELNPYEGKQQRQEAEVRMLLNKLQPEMIALDPDFIGTMDRRKPEERDKGRWQEEETKKMDEKIKIRDRQRGKNSALRKHLRKTGKKNIIDEKRLKLEAMKEKRKRLAQGLAESKREELGPAISRFYRPSAR